jgi:hypothetical protein
MSPDGHKGTLVGSAAQTSGRQSCRRKRPLPWAALGWAAAPVAQCAARLTYGRAVTPALSGRLHIQKQKFNAWSAEERARQSWQCLNLEQLHARSRVIYALDENRRRRRT